MLRLDNAGQRRWRSNEEVEEHLRHMDLQLVLGRVRGEYTEECGRRTGPHTTSFNSSVHAVDKSHR